MRYEEKARGGTELLVESLYRNVPTELLQKASLSTTTPQNGARHIKPNILWEHQSYDQPSVQGLKDERILDVIDKIVFVSQWQREKYIEHFNIQKEKTVFIHNTIEPISPYQKPRSPLKLIYTSTPFRGLDVLLDAFDLLSKKWQGVALPSVPIELHIYSGMGLYGSLRALEDTHFEALYAKARSMKNVFYHGVVSNEEVRKALQEAHIFAYPCTWEETSCLSLIEALSAGCLSVIPSLGALPETASGFAQLYEYVMDKKEHTIKFADELSKAIDTFWDINTQKKLAEQKIFFDANYSWENRKDEWTAVLQDVINKHGYSL